MEESSNLRKWFIAIGALLGGLAALVWQLSKHRGNVKVSQRLAVYQTSPPRKVFGPQDLKEWKSDVEKKQREITKAIEDGRKEEIQRKWKEAFGEHSSLSH